MGSEDPPGGVYISMRDIYDQLILTKDSVRDLKISVDSNKEYIDDMKEHLRPVLTDLEIRMRSLEHWRYSVPGAAVILALLAFALSAYAQFGGK